MFKLFSSGKKKKKKEEVANPLTKKDYALVSSIDTNFRYVFKHFDQAGKIKFLNGMLLGYGIESETTRSFMIQEILKTSLKQG